MPDSHARIVPGTLLTVTEKSERAQKSTPKRSVVMAMAVVACRAPVARAAAVRRGRTSRAPVVASALPLHIEFCQVRTGL